MIIQEKEAKLVLKPKVVPSVHNKNKKSSARFV